jgi:hypothetical protein
MICESCKVASIAVALTQGKEEVSGEEAVSIGLL